MILSFICGFLFAILSVIGAAIFAFHKLNTKIATSVMKSASQRADLRKEIDAAATLDPVKIISKVQFGTIDGIADGPGDKKEKDNGRMAGRSLRYGRITLVGSVISVYETVVVDRNGSVRPLKEMIKRDGSTSLVLGDFKSGEPASERLVGKIPISRLSVRIENFNMDEHNQSGTSSVTARYLVLQKEGADIPNQAYTFLPAENVDDTDPKWLAEQDPSHVVALPSPPLFSHNGARPDTKKGIIIYEGHEYASYSHHEDTPIRWRTLAIRFSTVRELERWSDVLTPSIVTNQWKVFLKSLPQVDVLNVLLSRVFFENRELKELNDIITMKINKKLAKVTFPSNMAKSHAVAHEVNVGGELPIFSNISPISTSACGEIAFDFDMWYRGGFTCKMLVDLAINTEKVLKLDFKAPSLEATVHLKELKGRVHLSIGAPPSHKMWLGFHELPEVNVELNLELVKNDTQTTIARLVMNALPDLSEILTNAVREKLFEDMTLPHLDDFSLPNVEKSAPSTPIDASLKDEKFPHRQKSPLLNERINRHDDLVKEADDSHAKKEKEKHGLHKRK